MVSYMTPTSLLKNARSLGSFSVDNSFFVLRSLLHLPEYLNSSGEKKNPSEHFFNHSPREICKIEPESIEFELRECIIVLLQRRVRFLLFLFVFSRV